MKLQEILELAVRDEDVADIFLVAGLPVAMKRNGVQTRMDMAPLMPKDIGELVEEIYAEAKRTKVRLEAGEDDDFSLSMSRRENFPGGRFRVNVFRQRGSLAAVIRVIRFELPDPRKLGIPEDILALTDDSQGRNNKNGGLVLVTGAAGTGKTTTLACMIDRINNSVIQELTLLDTIPAIDPALSGKIKYLTVALMFSEAIERIYQEVSISKLFR